MSTVTPLHPQAPSIWDAIQHHVETGTKVVDKWLREELWDIVKLFLSYCLMFGAMWIMYFVVILALIAIL